MPGQQLTQAKQLTQTLKEKKKTPSARVIAAMWLLDALGADRADRADRADDYTSVSLEPAALTKLADSRVSQAKALKVVEQVVKITAKLRERMQKAVDKFNGVGAPPKPKKKKAQPAEGESAQSA